MRPQCVFLCKPLYTLDISKGIYNMNKGPRIEKTEDKDGCIDLSFLLRRGTCFTMFFREEHFDEQKSMFAGTWNLESTNGVLAAYKPILLQLSGVNDEKALKGNGFKVRSLAPAPEQFLRDFYECFFESPSELVSAQTKTAEHISLRTITKPNKSSPIVCKIDHNAFVYREKGGQMLEIVNSGFGRSEKVLMDEQLLLEATNSQDVDRALRILSVAIGHNAVKCLIAPQDNRNGMTPDSSIVVDLNVDLTEAMWLNMLHKSKAGFSTVPDSIRSLPKTSMLTMCFGKSISDSKSVDGADVTFLQWYSPQTTVLVADAHGDEFLCHIVFEMMLVTKQMAGQRDVSNKRLFMDEVSGFHYIIKVFHAHKVQYSEEDGLTCTNATLLVTWQFRPGCNTSSISVPGSARKRVQMQADSLDLINSGDFDTDYEKNLSNEDKKRKIDD
jgi:hypothetical protein